MWMIVVTEPNLTTLETTSIALVYTITFNHVFTVLTLVVLIVCTRTGVL